MAQARLPGTLPSPEEARKRHKEAVGREREAERMVSDLKDAMKEARAAITMARKARQAAEDDLDAIEAGRRPG